MIISCIVATANNNVIGKDNDIPWYLPNDLKYFKKITSGHHILMGRKCYQSIGKPLPNRTNMVLTRDAYFISSNCIMSNSIEDALEIAYKNGEEELFIIGGGTIYEQTQTLWDKLYLTEVDLEVEGDIFFPVIDHDIWKLVKEEKQTKNDKNLYDHVFKTYIRK